MAVCDICNSPGTGTLVKAKDFSKAVSGGFNPFKAGLAPDLMEALGMGSSYPDWRDSAVSGPLSGTDWNVCSGCMSHLEPYLPESG